MSLQINGGSPEAPIMREQLNNNVGFYPKTTSSEAPIMREQLNVLKKTHHTTKIILIVSIASLAISIITLIIAFLHIL